MTANASNTGFNATNSSIAEGTYIAYFYCNDTSNNLNSSERITFTLDTTSPKVTINYPVPYGNYSSSSREFNVSLTEPGYCLYTLNSGVTNFTMVADPRGTGFNATNSSIAEGTYTAYFYCNDTANNVNLTESVTFTLDTTPPTCTDISNQSLFRNNQTLAHDINATDSETEVSSFSIDCWNCTSRFHFSIDYSTGILTNDSQFPSGDYYVNVSVNDSVDNTASKVILIQFNKSEEIPPDVTIDYPLPYGNYSSSSMEFNSSINEWGYCLYTFNSGIKNYSMTANASKTGFSSINDSIAEGTYTVSFYCNDSDDNINMTENVTFTLDRTPPDVTIDYPSPYGNYSSSTMEFNVSLNEPGYCEYSLDNGTTNLTMTSNSGNTRFSATNTSIAQGTYTADFYCNDTLNHLNLTESIEFSLVSGGGDDGNDGGGGGGGSSITSSWTITKIMNEDEFESGKTVELGTKNRARVKINEEYHHVGVVSIGNNSVTINVSSTPQQATFYVGDEKKFDVTDDNYYDIIIKLESIANNKANITIKSIYEQIIKEMPVKGQVEKEQNYIVLV